MFRLVLYFMLSLLLAEQTVAEECQQEAQQGCKVDAGHAQCESWNISASIHSLPRCITSMTFSLIKDPSYLRQYDYIELNEINFNQFKNLEELELNTNHGNYSHIFLVQDSKSLVSLKKINILRFRVMHYYNIELNKLNHNMYSNLRSLKILDLSRAKNLGLDGAKHVIGSKTSIKKLILKNIQEIFVSETYSASADLVHFVCQSKVQYLDLSYNDIVTLAFFLRWKKKLQF